MTIRPDARDAPPDRGGGDDRWRDEGRDGEDAFDPYFFFAVDTAFRFIRTNDDGELPIMLELTRPLDPKEPAARMFGHAGELISISPLYLRPPKDLEKMRYITALVQPKFFDVLASGALNDVVARFQLCAPLPKMERDPKLEDVPRDPDNGADRLHPRHTPAQQPQASPSGQGVAGTKPAPANAPVVMGIVDDAIAFANARFRASGGNTTRFDAFWGQDLPSFSGNGRVIDRNEIDDHLKKTAPAGIVDEDALYRRAGLDFLTTGHKSWAHRFGHGTHVLDVMAGMDPADVTAQSPVLTGVQLPVAVTEQTSGALLTSYALDGMQWIFKRAEQIAKDCGTSALPCVVNLSYGTLHGPHDGSSLLAEAIDERLAAFEAAGKRVAVVLPSGNGHLSQCHAHVALAPDPTQARTLRWRVLPDTRTPSFLEVWLPANAQWRMVEVQVTTPTGHVTPWIRQGDPRHCWPSTADPKLWIRYRGKKPKQRRRMILIAVFPTAPMRSGDSIAASGVYGVALRNVGTFALGVDAWIRRNDTPAGYPIRGRQSRFDESHYLETRYRRDGRPEEDDDGLSYVFRRASLNGLATGTRSIVAGGCRSDDLSPAPYSAGGPTMVPGTGPPPPRDGPDALTLAEKSHVRAGILAAGTRSGSTVCMRGTSVAAPQLARFVARDMEKGNAGNRESVRAEALNQEAALQASHSIEPNGPIKAPPSTFRGGAGRIVFANDLPPANRRR